MIRMELRLSFILAFLFGLLVPFSAGAQDNQEPPHAFFQLDEGRVIPLPATSVDTSGGILSFEFPYREAWKGKQVFVRIPGFEFPYTFRINRFDFGSDPGSGTISEYNITPFINTGSNRMELVLNPGTGDPAPDSCPLCDKTSLAVRDAMHVRDLVITTYCGTADHETLVRYHLFIKSYLEERNRGRELEIRVLEPGGDQIFMEKKALDFPLSFGQETELIVDHFLQDPMLWSPSGPRLYTAEVTISDQTGGSETISTPFGIRTAVRTGSFLVINGDSIRLTVAGDGITGSLLRKPETDVISIFETVAFNAIETDLALPHRLVDLFDRYGIVLLRTRKSTIPESDRPHINAPSIIWPGKN